MEKRNVQVTGGSSYIVTLPKEWIKEKKIKKNQKIGISMLANGNLVITPDYSSTRKERIQKFFVSTTFNQDLLYRLLIGAYIAANDVILVNAEHRINAATRECVLKFLNTVTGFIITEETEKSIMMKNTVSMEEIPIKNGILRISILVDSMFRDAFIALDKGDQELCQKIVDRDIVINTSHWLVMRQINHLTLQNRSFMETSPIISIYISYISQYVERIGNQSVLIAKEISKLIPLKPDKQILEEFSKIAEFIMTLFRESLNAFFDFDVQRANKCIEEGLNIRKKCGLLFDLIKKQPKLDNSIEKIIEYFSNIGDIISNIGEMTLDSYVFLTFPSYEEIDENMQKLVKPIE